MCVAIPTVFAAYSTGVFPTNGTVGQEHIKTRLLTVAFSAMLWHCGSLRVLIIYILIEVGQGCGLPHLPCMQAA